MIPQKTILFPFFEFFTFCCSSFRRRRRFRFRRSRPLLLLREKVREPQLRGRPDLRRVPRPGELLHHAEVGRGQRAGEAVGGGDELERRGHREPRRQRRRGHRRGDFVEDQRKEREGEGGAEDAQEECEEEEAAVGGEEGGG